MEILDIGCGIDPEGDVNCDIENVYQEYGCRPKNFVVAAAWALPFKDKSFKVAKARELIEHLEDEKVIIVLKEIKRVAEKAIFTVPNAYFVPASWKYSWTSIGSDYRKMLLKYPHKQIFDEVILKETLNLVFEKVKIEGTMGSWISIPLVGKVLSILSKKIPFLARILIAYCE